MDSSAYPPDDLLVNRVAELGSQRAFARELGVTDTAVSSYIRRRPGLQDRVRAALDAAKLDGKRCPRCKEWYSSKELGYRPGGRFLNSACPNCRNAMKRERRAADPNARSKEREYEQRPDVKAAARRRHIQRRYGLNPDAFDALVQEQEGRCAVCLQVPTRFDVDHDHRTGAVRGLLCRNCNVALGQLGDDLPRVQRLVHYLKRHEANS